MGDFVLTQFKVCIAALAACGEGGLMQMGTEMPRKFVLIFAVLLVPFAGPSPVFAQTDENIVIVCPTVLAGASGQDTYTLNLTAKTVVAEYRWSPNGQPIVTHAPEIITAITDQEIDWTMDPNQTAWIEKHALNRFTLDLDYVANSTGQMIHLSCHKQQKQL